MAGDKDVGKSSEDNDNISSAVSGMPGESRPQPVNRVTPPRDSYWFAHGGKDEVAVTCRNNNKHSDAKEAQLQKEREEKIRLFHEQREQERLKRVQELEQSFVLSRKHREQQEEERRRKIEDAKLRENERRLQVEERKRLIWEAERERKEAILRRNLDREARIEARRNAQRNSASFAFGSSTPRTFDLDLAALGRNAAVGCPLMSAVSSKRLDERDFGSKRATSACSLDRRSGDDCMSWSVTSLSSSSRGRRRTDLTPTMTRERSITPHVTPRAKSTSHSPSRPQSSMSGKSELSVASQTSGVVMRPKPAPRKPRPISIAGTTVERPTWNSSSVIGDQQPRLTEQKACPPPKPPRAKSNEPESKPKPPPAAVAKKPLPPPKSAQVLAKARSHPVPTKDNLRKVVKAPGEDKATLPVNAQTVVSNERKTNSQAEKVSMPGEELKIAAPIPPVAKPEKDNCVPEVAEESKSLAADNHVVDKQTPVPIQQAEDISTAANKAIEMKSEIENNQNGNMMNESTANAEMTKSRITSEEEARAALAEKRRLAREQAEKEAELERLHLEELKRQEEERKRQEELEQKRLEEEQIRLAELHRKMEEEKLRKAIEEQEQREKEEKARMEEEAKVRAEKEEQERKVKEEAERQRLELAEKLRKEEEERAERKRRVEQIMSRTRGKGRNESPGGSSGRKELPNDNESVPGSRPESEMSSDSNVISNNSNTSTETSLDSVVSNSVSSSFVATEIMQENVQSQPMDKMTAEQFNVDFFMNSNVQNGFNPVNSERMYLSANGGGVNGVPNWTSNVNATSPMQTNGYSSHEDSSSISSPEERSEKSDSSGLLLDLQPSQPAANTIVKGQVDMNQLIDIGMPVTSNSHNNNSMINVDVVNSNVNLGDPFVKFEDNFPKTQENTITDLLS